MKEFVKDPSEKLDFTVDLAQPMAKDVDTIASHTVTVPGAPSTLIKDSDLHTNTTVVAWLRAGTHGADYPVVYQATTAAGRIYERTILVRVRQR